MYTMHLCLAFVVFAICVEARSARNGRIWADCTSPSSPLKITGFNIQPDPVTLPGDMYYSMSGYSTRNITSSRMILSIKRLGRWVNIPIPCLFNIGSCTYPDLCTMLDQMISENWLGATRVVGQDIKNMLINNGLNPGLCPQPPTEINIVRNRLRLPTMPSALYWFAEGIYRANVKVVENSSNEEIFCINIDLDVKQREEESCWFWC